ncbi:hypothetical protein Tco_1311545 [Tanacetum coccineum]
MTRRMDMCGDVQVQQQCGKNRDRLDPRMVEIFEMVDVARGSRLGAWIRACCLFILPSKSMGVFRSNSTLVLEFSFP